MNFRPCIDIHNGKIKQIVGGSLLDEGNQAKENFVSQKDGTFYGNLYRENGLKGGHIIILNSKESEYYREDCKEARKALQAYPGGLQVGGGITDENAKTFLDAGATHVIVTSFVFVDGQIRYDRLEQLVKAVGKKHIVLDLSCRKKENQYYIVTNRWQTFTKEPLTVDTLQKLEAYCDEYLIHGVDVEGKSQGIDAQLVDILGSYHGNKITYAGGIRNFDDLDIILKNGKKQVDFTIGSALDLFGGEMEFKRVLSYCEKLD